MNIFIILTPDIFKVFGERVDRFSIVGDFGKIRNAVGIYVRGRVVNVFHSGIILIY